MSLNFFNADCQETPRTDLEFGLCDDKPGERAYTKNTDPHSWIATIKNKKGNRVVFTAIDKCVLHDNEYKNRGRCDGMLTTARCLYLVELKDQEPPWQTDALKQLESTIRLLLENHDISQFKIRKVFGCNKHKKDKFLVFDPQENIRFYRETSFRKDFQTNIVIV